MALTSAWVRGPWISISVNARSRNPSSLWSPNRLSKSEVCRWRHLAFHHRRDLAERVFVVSDGVRHDAVCRRVHSQVTHVRVICREQDADVPRDTRQNDPANTETSKQGVQCRVKESRVFRLQHEIVARGGPETLRHPAPG